MSRIGLMLLVCGWLALGCEKRPEPPPYQAPIKDRLPPKK